jgi:hypothetical protein
MFLIPPYVDIMTEKTELIITTKSIPASLSPISSIANGTHATLGNDCKPTAKELIVLPKPGNFTIANPTETPIMIDKLNPITRRYIVTAILTIKVKFSTKSTKDPATIAGDGNDTSGQIPKINTNCHIPKKTAMNKVTLARSSISNLTFLFFLCDKVLEVIVKIDSPFPL